MSDEFRYHGAADLEELEQHRAQAREFIEQLDYNELDPGIRRTVRYLRARGYFTVDSGDGSKEDKMEGARGEPHVCIQVPPEMIAHYANHLRRLLFQEHGIQCDPIGRGTVSVQGTYDPVDKVAIIDLIGVDDSMLKEFEDLPPMPEPDILDAHGKPVRS